MESIINTSSAVSRRKFLTQSAIGAVGLTTFGLLACAGQSNKPVSIRVIAYNILKCTGWPVEHVEDESQIPALIAQELSKYKPDIVNFSESPEESVVKQIADLLQMDYVYFPSGGNWPGAVLTHHEILDSVNVPVVSGARPETLFTRHWGRATLRIAGSHTLTVHSAHLYPFDTPEGVAVRRQEIREIVKSMETDRIADKKIIVIGDLNHTPDVEEYAQWMDAGFVDSFIAAGEGDGFTIRADTPNKRIDYVLSRGLEASAGRPLFEGAFRTDPSVPDSFALSDHLPYFAQFDL
ncbi:endonuclease/exonuclease/phosphatase family protein [Parapedobacter sp. 10938]|uniref:endonuclease/exonuclease/phosphatase family protein n=1 Tax=Parapedobacter flavus TaxID=3110225 RepID=UPI002DBADD17|nr:endonuclease/exonuclease/phosphatase family protein [Parapedobacter sp. 10938]MEC3878139.1 endonuclease/exonuclease/phosphatase family protein [Parapedobacter sp. 10938]